MSEFAQDFLIDALPDEFQSKIDKRIAQDAATKSGSLVEAVFEKAVKWRRGQTILVAFRGADETLCGKIADAANEWSKHGNIKFNFKDPVTGKHRQWSPSDIAFKADIRIQFDEPGYWSLVGKDSIDESIIGPGQGSMNFSGYPRALPADWKATVLHEFGHALALHHEHQHPVGFCEAEFRFEDDPGYVKTTDSFGQFIADPQKRRPGIYTVLAGEPNRWSKPKVDHNLRKLPASRAFETSKFDKDSIMKYFFGAWMFKSGESSKCFSKRNEVLSDGDKAGFRKAYPKS